MTKKWKLALISGIILISSFLIYWFFLANPTPFLSDEDIIKEIHALNPDANIKNIQDKIFLNDSHVFVPHLSEEARYGASYWVWEMHRWKLVIDETSSSPNVWRIDPKDPSTHFLVWNFHPDDKQDSLSFFFIKERGFQVSDGVETYEPHIQLEHSVSMDSKSYGVQRIPSEWITVLRNYSQLDTRKVPNSFIQEFLPNYSMYFGWILYDVDGKEHSPRHSTNGSTYHADHDEVIDFVRILNEVELE